MERLALPEAPRNGPVVAGPCVTLVIVMTNPGVDRRSLAPNGPLTFQRQWTAVARIGSPTRLLKAARLYPFTEADSKASSGSSSNQPGLAMSTNRSPLSRNGG